MRSHPQSWRRWILDVVSELRAIGTPWAIERASRLLTCGRTATVEVCAECGRPHERTARAEIPSDGPCESRCCPFCAQRRARKTEKLAARAADLEWSDDAQWQTLTLTMWRDRDDPEQARWPALRERARTMRGAATQVVRRLRRAGIQVYAAWAGVECAGVGHVHLHMLLCLDAKLTDWTDNAKVRRLDCDRGAEFWPNMCESLDVGEIYACKPTEGVAAVREVVKYAMKVPSSDEWLGGVSAPDYLPPPAVAAHWEVAVRGLRLRERWGKARQIPLLDPPEEPAETVAVDEPEPCPQCQSTRRRVARGYTSSIAAEGWRLGIRIFGGRGQLPREASDIEIDWADRRAPPESIPGPEPPTELDLATREWIPLKY